jgi:hypothetical protein
MPFVLSRGPPLPLFPALLVTHSSKIVGRLLTLEVARKKSTYKKRGAQDACWFVVYWQREETDYHRVCAHGRQGARGEIIERRIAIAREAGKKGGRPRKAQG